jgi:hypothetical protein
MVAAGQEEDARNDPVRLRRGVLPFGQDDGDDVGNVKRVVGIEG